MEKFLIIVMILISAIVSGCGSSKYSDETFLLNHAGWVEKEEYARDFLDALESNDNDFLTQQIIDGKIKTLDKETKIAVLGDTDGGKIVKIKFSEGRYKNSVGYTLAEYIKDVEKEKKLIEMEKSRTIPFDELSSADKQSYDSLLRNGVEIEVLPNMSIRTNLPEGTKLIASGVEITIKDSSFPMKYSRASMGTQINIQILDEQKQPVNVRTINAEIIKNKGEEFSILKKYLTVNIRE